jgi:hypothetical protein
MSRMMKRKVPATEEAKKRRRIQQNAAILTVEDYLVATPQPKIPRANTKKSSVPLKITPCPIELSSSSSDEEVMSLHVSANDFVLLRLVSEGRKKSRPIFYVGLVISAAGPKMWRIKCMRRHGDSDRQFVFPDEHDIDTYLEDEIVTVLSSPKIVRNIHYFSDDFSAHLGGGGLR